jgi:hypothetical protein
VKFRAAGDLGGIEQDLNLHKKKAAEGFRSRVGHDDTGRDPQAHVPNYIDYMNLDVEGAEYDVLRGLSLDRYQFGSMTVEHNFEPSKRKAIHKLLTFQRLRVRSVLGSGRLVRASESRVPL